MQQGLGYGELLQVPFVFSSNGDRFLFHNKIATDGIIEREIGLVDQTMTNDFKPFGSTMTKIKQRQADKSYEIYLSLYQAQEAIRDLKRSLYSA